MRPGFFFGSSPSDRPSGRPGRKSGKFRKAKLRRAALEGLEPRTLLATLPTPAILDRINVSGSDTTTDNNRDESSPAIAVDPTNPSRLVAAWTEYNTNPTTPVARLQGAVSTNGGATWSSPFSLSSPFSDPTTSNPTIPFTRVLNASVGVDRSGNVYVAALQTNGANSAGVVTFEKFAFSPSGGGLTSLQPTRLLHEWQSDPQSAAQHVTLLVDSTPALADAGNGLVQANPYAGNVYVAWNTLDLGPTAGNDQFAPQAIYAVGSSDGGLTFTTPRQISDAGFNRTGGGAVTGPVGNRMPRLAINPAPLSDPLAPARGGRVSFVWDDFASGTGPGPNPFDVITYDRTEAVLVQRFEATGTGATGAIQDAVDPGGGAAHVQATTLFPFDVNLTEGRFLTIEDLDVEVRVTHPVVAELEIILIPPPGSGLAPITLLDNNVSNTNANTGQGATGTALGGNSPYGNNTPGAVTRVIFDAQARTSIVGQATPRGYFRPRDPGPGQPNPLEAINGLPANLANGTWTLSITDYRATGNGPPAPVERLDGWALRFSSGLTPQLGGSQVATSTVLGSTGLGGSVDTAAGPININASPVIAVDATVGVASQYRGRIYVAYVDRSRATGNPADNTEIQMAFSDDGGQSWTPRGRVNDDLADRDGFSEANGGNSGRPQFMPEVAVDPATGTLAVQFYDARHDASKGRVAMYAGASIDGGQSFSAQGFVNAPESVFDVATGAFRTVGPIPDNQSGDNPNTDGTFGFGTRQGLAISGGRIYTAWSSNLNGGPDGKGFLDIRVARATTAAGPRGDFGTSGVVDTLDTSGTPQAREFVVVFDRRINPSTFSTNDITILGRRADGTALPAITATNVVALDPVRLNPGDPSSPIIAATTFLVTFAGQTTPGTYSYAIGPNVADVIGVGNLMDQDADATPGEAQQDRFAAPRAAAGGVPLNGPFDRASLPLIVPGPRVVSTQVIAGGGGTTGSAGPNLVLNGTVAAFRVTFDRDMQGSTFTVEDVLRIVGPAGPVDRSTFTVTQLDARTFEIGFAVQQLSGTYQLLLGSNIQSVGGFLVDTDQDAGVDVLRGGPVETTAEVTFPSGDVPRSIPANGSIESTLVVDKSFEIRDLDVQLNIAHTNDPDLTVELVAPNGTTIRLFSGVGDTGDRDNFTNTILDDEATLPIGQGTPPFSSRFRPQQPLSALDGSNSLLGPGGAMPTGAYRLRITNAGSVTGTLNSWRLTFREPVTGTGLGEPVADRIAADFRIFTMAEDNGLSSSTWTPVGPASINGGGGSGRVTGLAVDPSDPSGNTVFVGGASGGVWKTNNFLTTDGEGPTWTPLLDRAATMGTNTGGIAVFGRNNDPNQSLVFVATGEGDVFSRGVGLLRSSDGGRTWELLDSLSNTGPFAQRGHELVGLTAFDVVVDPRPTATGEAIVYAAFSSTGANANGGVYRSIDSGRTWQQVLAGQATDIELDPTSGPVDIFTNPTGNLQNVFAALRGQGVLLSTAQGRLNSWNLMTGGVGKPQVLDQDLPQERPVPVANQADTPNGAKGRIVLAKPFLAGSDRENLLYSGWLYAAVATTADRLDGLYMTKDYGQNWTRLRIPTLPTASGGILATPTNDITRNDYDPLGNDLFAQGNFDIALTIDPTNPHVVYLGGTTNGQESGLIRVDATNVNDPHAFFLNNDLPGGADRRNYVDGAVTIEPTANNDPRDNFPSGFDARTFPVMNLLRNPFAPLSSDITVRVNNAGQFANSGAGVRWTPFDAVLTGTDVHRALSYVDPLTGRGRLIFGYDQGIASGVDAGDGTLLRQVGNNTVPTGSRNGNLQITQLYYGASQPSDLTAQIAGALLYGQAQDDGFPRSDPDLLETGNINWNGPFGDGTGVATDQTGSGTAYYYNWPCCGGGTTSFFRVDTPGGGPNNGVGRTTGLIQQSGGTPVPDPQWPFLGGSNFAVNPVNGQEIVMSSAVSGRLFRTLNRGLNWFPIAEPATLGSAYLPALAFGAPATPDSEITGDYIVGGNTAGGVYVTYTGGAAWTQINNGALAGNTAPFQAVVTNPRPGTFEAYAVTSNAVYHIDDTRTGTWTDITSNVFQITHEIFGDEAFTDGLMANLKALSVDWRYAIPSDFDNPPPASDQTNPALTHPVLYVAGEGGVLSSYDDGASWQRFPSALPDSISTTPENPGDGGGFPVADVRDLDLALGHVDRRTGIPQSRLPGPDGTVGTADDIASPDILVATTFGRGAFAIRVAPVVFPESLRLVIGGQRLPSGGQPPVISPSDLVFEGFSAQSATGNAVRLRAFEIGPNDEILRELSLVNPDGTPGAPTTDSAGNFTVRLAPGSFPTAGPKRIGIQADQGGTTGNIALFELVVDVPAPTLLAESDTGRSGTDLITNDATPTFQLSTSAGQQIQLFRRAAGTTDPFVLVGGPDAAGQVTDQGPGGVGVPGGVYEYAAGIAGIFSTTLVVTIDVTPPAAPAAPASLAGAVTSTPDPSFTVAGAEPGAEVRLYRRRASEPSSPTALIVGSAIAGPGGVVTIRDPGPLADGDYEYSADQVDVAGNVGPRGPLATLMVRGSIVQPPPVTLALEPADDTGTPGDNITANRRPRLTGTTAAGATVQLLDGDGNPLGAPAQVGATGAFTLQFPAPLADGTYTVRARVIDLTGNVGLSDPLAVTIDTTPAPGVADLGLAPESDTGLRGDLRTSVRRPFLTGTTEPGSFVEIFAVGLAEPIASGTADAQGRFRLQGPGEFANGTVTLRARSRDAAGNPGDFGPPIALTIESFPGDVDLDGRADLVFYRPGTVDGQSQFFISRSTGGAGVVGSADFRSSDPSSPLANAQLRPGDIPISGDFDGDGVMDVGVFRPSSDRLPSASEWIIRGSRSGPRSVLFGGAGLDVPAVGDFDGDGRADIAVFRPVSDLLPGAAEWFILPSSSGQGYRVSFGAANGVDLPAVADFDGDGRDDIATFRPSPHPQDLTAFDPEGNGVGAQWFILRSSLPVATAGLRVEFGAAAGQVPGGLSDQPVPLDFDGDGRADIAAYRPSTAEWFLLPSGPNPGYVTNSGGFSVQFGVAGDVPAPADYDGDGLADLTTFRPATGRWTVRQSADNRDVPTDFGTTGDVPVFAPLAYRDPRPDSIANPTPTPAAQGQVAQVAQAAAAPAPDMGRLASQLGGGVAGRSARGRAEALARLRALRGLPDVVPAPRGDRPRA